MSYGTFSRGRALLYRADFALRWADFLHRNFDSPEAVAVAFAVEGTTARKWWRGEHAPGGAFVALAFSLMPAEAARALREAA